MLESHCEIVSHFFHWLVQIYEKISFYTLIDFKIACERCHFGFWRLLDVWCNAIVSFLFILLNYFQKELGYQVDCLLSFLLSLYILWEYGRCLAFTGSKYSFFFWASGLYHHNYEFGRYRSLPCCWLQLSLF